MGPYVVPKEFLPDCANLQVTTRVNDEVVQDSNTAYLNSYRIIFGKPTSAP